MVLVIFFMVVENRDSSNCVADDDNHQSDQEAQVVIKVDLHCFKVDELRECTAFKTVTEGYSHEDEADKALRHHENIGGEELEREEPISVVHVNQQVKLLQTNLCKNHPLCNANQHQGVRHRLEAVIVQVTEKHEASFEHCSHNNDSNDCQTDKHAGLFF